MTFRLLAPVGLMALVIAAGCSTQRNVAWPDPRPLGEELPAYKPPVSPDAAAETPSADDPAVRRGTGGRLTLPEALTYALLYNPELRAFAWEVRAREARALQAGLWPNPSIAGGMEEFGGTGPLRGTGAAEISYGMSQLLPLGGDIGARERVAARERDLAGWDYEAARLDVFTQTTQAFTTALAAQERLAVADTLLAIARQFYETVAARARAGQVSPLEEQRARVVLATAEIDYDRAERQLEAARERLVALWGVDDPAFERVVGQLRRVEPVPPLDTVSAFIERNPEVARWQTELALRRAELDLAEARRFPDVTLSAERLRFRATGERAFAAAISLPLPLFDRDQGTIQAARYRLRQGRASRESARVEARRRLADAYAALGAAYIEATTLATDALPAARGAFEGTREGYDAGRFGLLRVLDAQRTLFQVINRYVDALERYHLARAAVAQLIGTPLDMIRNE